MRNKIAAMIFLFFFLQMGFSFAATYYMATSGSNSNNGDVSHPWLTLQYSFTRMTGGDTLIIRDGTYTGLSNAINSGHYPPLSSSAWTVIKAEHDGAVVFDGQSANDLFSCGLGSQTNCHWQFEGIIWGNAPNPDGSNMTIVNCMYVKFIRCGAYEAGNNNTMNFSVDRYCDYILLEGCYAWGSGRYKFGAYQSNHIIFRNCVGRIDRVNASGEPIAVFTMYSVNDGEVQNCIAIDSDQDGGWIGYKIASFTVPSTDMDANRINFTNCIALNNHVGGLSTAGNTSHVSSDVTFNNCVIWDCTNDQASPSIIKGLRTQILNCNFGATSISGNPFIDSSDSIGYSNASAVKNSIFYLITGVGNNVFYDVETYNNNDYYGNTATNPSLHSGDQIINPVYNISTNSAGGLKYLTRVETGSNLSGKGESGSDVGANIKTLIGALGTLWGEAGYNADTGISMWPFPNQDLIRTKMKAYNVGGVSGNRGFCADGETLTHYIMNYLGNGDPYSGLQITTSSLPDGTVGSAYSQTLQVSGGSSPYTWYLDDGSLPTGMSLESSNGLVSGTCNILGAYNFVIKVVDNTSTQVTKSLSIVMNASAVTGVGPGGGGGGGCFIATAVYGNRNAKDVIILTKFRDQFLMRHILGRVFVKFYYYVSPPIARYISHRGWICHALKNFVFNPLVFWVSLSSNNS